MNTANSNPYIGPRPFKKEEAMRFFGREREARDLLALVSSQRMVLFYASSGAGKSSLINARLIDALAGRGFEVLPVGRVSGVLPRDVGVDVSGANLFSYFLKQSLAAYSLDAAQTEADRQLFQEYASVSLSEFLLRLANAGKDENGNDRYLYTKSGATSKTPPATLSEDAQGALPPRALFIDQFEEIFTTNLQAWRQRGDFFEQLRQAMEEDPFLWVVLVMREDFIANLDPLAHLMPGELRARYYMQRMGQDAALEAVMKPVEIEDDEHPEWYRPFVPQTAERLVNNLRQVHAPTEQMESVSLATGEFVEPVQLQVVCYQLWEQLRDTPGTEITDADLDRLAGGQDLSVFVDRALGEFYEQALRRVVENAGGLVNEMDLRRWFSERLITEAGTRGFVYRGETETGGLPNDVVQLIAAEFLIRSESRAGGTWYELSHDRFVDPIQRSNQRWDLEQLQRNPLLRRAHEWVASHRDPAQRGATLLLSDDELNALDLSHKALGPDVEAYVEASQQASKDRQLVTSKKRERAERRRKNILAVFALVAVVASIFALSQMIRANDETDRAKLETAKSKVAEALAQTATAKSDEDRKKAEDAKRAERAARQELESVDLARIASRLDLKSEDQRQFALLLSMQAMVISSTLPAQSASIEALDAAYRNRAQWQPTATPPLMFTQSLTLPFSSPLTMTLSRDGNTVAAVEAGPVVMIGRVASDWVTDPVLTNFARISALALSDDGGRIAVAGCGQRPEATHRGAGRPASQGAPGSNEVKQGCDNWRIEILPTNENSQLRRVVKLSDTDNGVVAMAFHPTLLHLVAATGNDSLLYWRFSAMQPVSQTVTANQLSGLIDVSVSPDGMYLAALDHQGRNRVWSWNTWGPPEDDWPTDLKDNSYRSVSFLHSGEWFAAGSDCPAVKEGDQPTDPCPVVRLWDRETLAPIGPPLSVGENILDVGFDEQTDTLTVLGSQQMVRWNLNSEEWPELACQRAGRDMTYLEWKEAFPNAKDMAGFKSICGFPLHPSFVQARIEQAILELDDCNPQGRQGGWDTLHYQNIDPLSTAMSILVELALKRFEPKQDITNNPAASSCLEQANMLRKNEGVQEIPLEEAMSLVSRLRDAESRLDSGSVEAMHELDAVRQQLADWSVDLDSRLAADYQAMCFDQGYMDACTAVRDLSGNTLIAYGDTKEGEIVRANEGAPWYFWGSRGEAVTIAMDAIGYNFDTILVLDRAGGQSALAQDDDSGEGYNSLIKDFVLPKEGMYRIRPQAYGGQGAFRLELQGRTLPEIDFGKPIASNTAQSGPWIFDGKAGQIVTLDMEISGDGFDPYLTLQRAGESIEENSRDGRIDPVTLTADDLYLVTADLGYGSGTYSITLNLLEPLTLTIDQPEVSTTETNEIWAFEGAAGQIVNITLASSDPDQFNPDVDLRDSLGGVSTDSSGDRTTARIRNAILPKAGTYYVRTGPGHNSTPYTLTVSMGSSPTLTPGVTKEATSDEATLWSIDGQAGQIISASVVADVAFTDLKLSLLASRGESLTSVYADWETGSARIPNYVLRTDGPKYLRVDGLDGQATYQLRVEQIQPAELTTGPSVTSTTDGATFWTLAAEPGQIVQISLNATDDSGLDPILRLFDADGQQIDYNDDGGEGLNSLLTTVLPGSSSYLVQADNYGGSGAFNLAVDVLTPESLPLDNAPATVLPNRVWSVEGKPGQVLSVDITDTGDFSYPYLQLVASDGVVLASNEGSGSMTALLSRAGAYYILPRSVADSGEDTITARLSDATAAPNLNEIASQTLTNLASYNAIDQALTLYDWGTTDGGVAFTANARNALCWFGALRGAAQQVITVCDDLVQNAGTSDPYDLGKYRDSRGVALALTDKEADAAVDFEFYAANGGYYAEQRREWARRLRAGEPAADVLDEATLQELLSQ